MSDFQTLQTEFTQWLSTLQTDDGGLYDNDRAEATERLAALLNAGGFSLTGPDYGVDPGQFESDGVMHIECGPKDRWRNGKWEIVIWLDQAVQSTTHDNNLGGLFEGSEISLSAVINNPQLLMDNLKDLIDDYHSNVQDLIDEDEYDFNNIDN